MNLVAVLGCYEAGKAVDDLVFASLHFIEHPELICVVRIKVTLHHSAAFLKLLAVELQYFERISVLDGEYFV